MKQTLTLHENLPTGKYRIYHLHKSKIIPVLSKYWFTKLWGSLEYETPNLIVDIGRETILDVFISAFTDSQYDTRDHEFGAIAIGTGTNPPTGTDVTLQTISADGWKDITERYRVGTDAFAAYTFAATEGNGSGTLIWKEVALRNKSTVLYTRASIDYTKTDDYQTVVEWKFSWS